MTTVAQTFTGVNFGAAKRKFFHPRHDVYAKYNPSRNNAVSNGSHSENRSSRDPSSPSASCTVFGSAFSPPYRNKKYFVACTSNGCVAVWDPLPCCTAPSFQDTNYLEKLWSSVPIFTVHVASGNAGSNNQVLYDLRFIETSNGDHLLVVSGDPGVVVYKWSDFEAVIDMRGEGGECNAPTKKAKCQDPQDSCIEMIPQTTFRPHPSPAASFGESVEINCASYCRLNGILFGAAGDAFGCYQWDLASERLLGTFGGAGRFDSRGHRDYLHVVKTISENDSGGSRYLITGGEDGNFGLWEGKAKKLIEMMNVQTIMDKNKDLVTSNTTPNNRCFMVNSSTPWNNGSNLWVSSMDTRGDWLAVCGGAESMNNPIVSRSGPSSSGFAALWHLPTRSFTSGSVTRENLNTVVYNSAMDNFVSGGNEGRISFWESTTMTRSRCSWSTPPAAYTVSVDPESTTMVVGGSGGVLDCFVGQVKVSHLHVIS